MYLNDLSKNIEIKDISKYYEKYDIFRADRGLTNQLIDKVILTLLLLIALPLGMLIVLFYVFDKGPPFYKQCRVGKNGKVFDIYKFRTMICDAEKKTGPVYAKKNDSRVTLLGHILRRFHLDEIPQLYNVIKGDMCLIGPRPERPEIIKEIIKNECNDFHMRNQVKPGITGLSQILIPYGENNPEKLKYDLILIKNYNSFKLNIYIYVHTIKKVLTGKTVA